MDLFGEALQQGIAPAIVVAIYLVITKIIDSKRESEQAKLSKSLTESVNTISDFVLSITKNVLEKDKEKCKNAIEDSMFSSCFRLTNFVSTTLIHNHIEANKKNIMINIHNIISAEYYTTYSTLSEYVINEHKISDFMKSEWLTEVEDDIICILYDNTMNKEDKILAFTNKINIRFQSYITYIINNGLK